ncbi:MAG: Rha family transcriptional regulator [Methylovulum sp.]|nr:Rha family transcriptional regulator [Methylovulum sp.]
MTNTAQATPEICPHVAIINGEIKTTSLKIAEHFGKQHKSVLRTIEKMQCSADFRERNFALSSYAQSLPKSGIKNLPCYEITRDGFAFLVMGFTGAKAAQWKEAYITAFNRMEHELQASLAPPSRARILMHLTNGQIERAEALPDTMCLVSVKDTATVVDFIRFVLPEAFLPTVLNAATQRVLAILERQKGAKPINLSTNHENDGDLL